MRKSVKLFTILLPVISFCLTGCNNKSNQGVLPPPDEDKELTDEIYLGLFETKEYVPSTKTNFEVTIEDNTLVEYFDGMFITNIKEGTTIAHFDSPAMKYTVTVIIRKDSTVPVLSISNENVSIYKDTSFSVNTSISYRGVNVDEYRGELKITKETDNHTSDCRIDGYNAIFTGLDFGTDSYTIYTEFAGFTLSKRINITTKSNNGLVVCGHNLTYSNEGPRYSISMYQYAENKINFRDDITVLKGGTIIPYSDLNITFSNTSILDIDPTTYYLIPKARGDAKINISYQGETISISANVYKPLIGQERVEISDHDFDLDLSVTKLTQGRKYQANTTKSKDLLIPGTLSYNNLASLSIENSNLTFNSSDYTYNSSTRVLNLKSKIFNIKHFGQKMLTVTMEGNELLYSYTYLINFITKRISTKDDISNYLIQLYGSEVILGQYVLANDIDFAGAIGTGTYVKLSDPINYEYGFKGIIDGDNHKICNYKSTMYGLFLLIGSGAIVKNLHLSNVLYNSIDDGKTLGNAIFSRFVSGITFQNITVDFNPNSITDIGTGGALDSVGIFAAEVFNASTIINVTINAQNFDLLSIFGKNCTGNTYRNVNVYCKSLRYVGYNYTEQEGVNVITA